MRIDGNSMGKPKYFPNSYHSATPSTQTTPSFNPHVAEAPYQVANNIVSRQSYWRHEADPSEYNQVSVFATHYNADGHLTLDC